MSLMQDLYEPEQKVNITVKCPMTNETATSREQQHQDSPYGKLIWWLCEECQSWHLYRSNIQEPYHQSMTCR